MAQESKLNPRKYKTFIPDQYKVGAQKNDTKSIQSNFFETSKTAYTSEKNADIQPVRTLDFVREKLQQIIK